jgi:formamidopyrimidine-DNA glycosylase
MPELPDVEVFKRYVDSTALHQTISEVSVKSRQILRGVSPQTLVQKLQGHQLASSRRHGKLLFLQLAEHGGSLVLHFGMTGFLKYCKDGETMPPHTRLLLGFAYGAYLAFDCQRMLGEVAFAADDRAYIEARGLGPDALQLEWEPFKERMATKRNSIKAALMDQGLMAGIGNIYSDEILFQVRLHPYTAVNKLSEQRLHQIYKTMKAVLAQAIQYQVDPTRMPQSWLLPHRDPRGQCPSCGEALVRHKVNQRSAYFCPHCQKQNA